MHLHYIVVEVEFIGKADKLQVEALKVVVADMKEDLRQRKIGFNFSLVTIVVILVFCGFLLWKSLAGEIPFQISISISVAASIMFYASRSFLLRILQKSDNELLQPLKSQMRGLAKEKLERWLPPRVEENRSSEKQIRGKTEISIR